MRLPFCAARTFEAIHNLLHILRLVFVRDQDCVCGLHHNQIIYAHTGNQATLGQRQGIAAVLQHHISLGHVTVGIFGQHIPQRLPSAYIRPTSSERYHHAHGQSAAAGGLPGCNTLHHRIVNRVTGALPKSFFAYAHKFAVGTPLHPRTLARLGNVGAAYLQCRQPHRCPHHKQTAVPRIRTLVQVRLGRLGIGLFYKPGNLLGIPRSHSVARLDVAIAGLRCIWRNAKRHHHTALGQHSPLANGLLKSLRIHNDMVSRHHQQDRVRSVFHSCKRSNGKGWGRIST